MSRKPIKIIELVNTYKDYIKVDLPIKSSSVIEYTHPKCGHQYTTTLALFLGRKQFEYCISCIKKIKNPIPLQYQDNIVYLDDFNICGMKTRIEYKNPFCGHISKSTIGGFLQRRQFERCSNCVNRTILDYLIKIPEQYHDCFLVKPQNTTSLIKFKHPGCGHITEISFQSFSLRSTFEYCQKCRYTKDVVTLDYYLDKIPKEYHENISVIGVWKGYCTNISYIHPICGHETQTIIGTFINRTGFDICLDCFIPNKLTKEHINDELMLFISDIQVPDTKLNQDSIISAKCNNCKSDILEKYSNLRSYYKKYNKPQCKKCCPKSFYQQELYNFIHKICNKKILYDDRTVIKINDKNSELDIFVPELKFAIEYNGIVWHDNKHKNKRYHFEKTKECIKQGISLLHIWDDLYLSKKEIYHSIIKVKLGLITSKIFARKTVIRELSKSQLKEFFDNNHLDGHSGCITGWGLFYNDILVQAISVRRVNSQNKKYKGFLEIAREATLIDHLVVGGESKLLSEVEKYAVKNGYRGILNYVSCEFGGFPKSKWKFVLNGLTPISYFYTDTHRRISRQKLQKRPLGKSEKDFVNELGLLRIDSCPNLIYVLEFKNE